MKKLLSSLFAVLFTAGIAFAQPPEPPTDAEDMPEPPQINMEGNMPQHPAMPKEIKKKKSFDEIAKDINLTDEQKQQIETMAKADKDKKKEIRNQMKEKFKAIDAELLKENYDINVVNNLTAEVQTLQSEMSKMNIDGKIQMRNILTYDQFKQIEEMRQKNKNKFMKKMHENKDEVAVSSTTAKAADVKAEKIAKSSKYNKSSKSAKSSKKSKSSK